MDQRNGRRGGFYWLDGKPYPSVTHILDVVAKPQLQYWFGQQVYRATIADPSISEKDALNAPYALSKKAGARGSTVHSIVEVFKHTDTFETFMETVVPDYAGYARTFWRWVQEYRPEIEEHERTVVSRKHGYAGTLDMIAHINGHKLIVDAKTGKDIYPNFWLQLSAYRQALKEEGTEVDGVAVLLLGEEGYKYEVSTQDHFRTFFACKVLWEYANSETLVQLNGYAKNGKKESANGTVSF